MGGKGLTDAEMAIMRTHARIGRDILVQSDSPLFQLAAEVAWCHHEKWDGTGYPRQLSGQDIPESARIVALADVFDALTMARPYKDAWPVDKAIAFLCEQAGRHFDPTLVSLFCEHEAHMLEIKQRWYQQEQDASTSLRHNWFDTILLE